MFINKVFTEVRTVTIESVYGRDFKKDSIPGYKIIDFRIPLTGELVLGCTYKPILIQGSLTYTTPFLILKKNLRKRYIFEESDDGVYRLNDCREVTCSSGGLYFNPKDTNTDKTFILKEEEL